MLDQFKTLLVNAGLNEATANQFSAEFASVAFLAVVGASKDRFTEVELTEIKALGEEKRYDAILDRVQAKYPGAEWASLVTSVVEPLAKDYIETVVQGK